MKALQRLFIYTFGFNEYANLMIILFLILIKTQINNNFILIVQNKAKKYFKRGLKSQHTQPCVYHKNKIMQKTGIQINEIQKAKDAIQKQIWNHFDEMKDKMKISKSKLNLQRNCLINLIVQLNKLVQLPPDYSDQHLFLIDFCKKSGHLLSEIYEISKQYIGFNPNLLARLSLMIDGKIMPKFDVYKFTNFNNWNHLVSLSFSYCDWFGNKQWKLLVDQGIQFKNMKFLCLKNNNMTEVKKSQIQKLEFLWEIFFCKILHLLKENNPFTHQTIQILEQFRRKTPQTKIYYRGYDEQLKKIRAIICKCSKKNKLFTSIQNQLRRNTFDPHVKYYEQKWDVAMKFLSQIEAKKIDIDGNKIELIPREIVSIRWVNLEQLNLNNNLIHNIEAVSFLHMPYLKQLVVYHNRISNFHSFSKTNWNFLQKFHISQNPCSSVKEIHRMKLSKDFQNFIPSSFGQYVSQDLSFILKLESKKIKYLFLSMKSMIGQTKIIHSLRRKCNIGINDLFIFET